jgi:hypothetical protein
LSGKRGAVPPATTRHDPAGGALELFPSAAVRGDRRRASGAKHNRVVIGASDDLVVVDAAVLAGGGHDIVGVQAWRLAEDAGSGAQQHQRSVHRLERVTGASLSVS